MRTSPHAALAAAALVCLAVTGPPGPAHAAEEGPIVPTTAGPVLGATESGLEVFRGIPYAAPPVDDRRWLPPAPVLPWTDVRDATSFGPACPQDPDLHEMAEGTPTSEDCLTLNVWTPSTGGRAPVMVFIHGGGFTAGSTWDPWYDGASFARRGVVLVTLQYRIGPFGWLDVSDLGSEYATSGNNGLQDQMAALRWVRENAAAFGGDPGNVTLFAESAGAISVSALMGVPAADGLYDRVILESGTAGTVATPAWSQRVYDRFVELSGVAKPQDLAALSTEQLLDTARRIYDTEFSDTAFHPLVDGTLLPDLPMKRIASPDGPSVPLIIGTNLDEARYWLYYIPELDRLPLRYYRPWLESLVGDRADDVIADYRRERPDLDQAQTGLALAGDVGFRMPATRMAEALSDRGVPVWMYLATVQSPEFDGRMGASHAIELPFVFDNLSCRSRPGAGGRRSGQRRSRRHDPGVVGGVREGRRAHRRGLPPVAAVRQLRASDADPRPGDLGRRRPAPGQPYYVGHDAVRRLRPGVGPADAAAVRGHEPERPPGHRSRHRLDVGDPGPDRPDRARGRRGSDGPARPPAPQADSGGGRHLRR